jgi:hypothetical protein
MNTDAKRAGPEDASKEAAPKKGKGSTTQPAPGTVAPAEKRWTTFRIRERENVPPKK